MTVRAAVDFLSHLAYPDNAELRLMSVNAMRAYYLRHCKAVGAIAQLGAVMPVQQVENQLRRLKARLEKRLMAADDCVRLDTGLEYTDCSGRSSIGTLNRVAAERQINEAGNDSIGATRYKSDWWRPEVMHMAIALRQVQLRWFEPRNLCLVPREFPVREFDPGWVTHWPFTVETLLILWPDWIDQALSMSAVMTRYLSQTQNPALRGFKNTTFRVAVTTHP